MALQKPRQFQYDPPTRRARQLREAGERRPIQIPHVGEDTRGSRMRATIRAVLMLAAVLALALAMTMLR